MRTIFGALAIAGGAALICCEGAQAMSGGGTGLRDAVTAASMVQLAGRGSARIHHARSDAETARQVGQRSQRGSTGQQ